MDNTKARVLDLLREGLSSNEIARRLGVSPGTVAAYKAHASRGPGPFTRRALGLDSEEAADPGEAAEARGLKFGLERDMQQALRRHIDQLEPGLHIVDEGRERSVESGFIDILAEDEDGSLVVIELKSGEAPDSAVTQILSYIGSLQAETSQRVRGVLVAREFSPRIRLAAAAARIQLVEYGFSFTFDVVTGGPERQD